MRRTGLTLIEVLASLALLGTVLSSLLLGASRFARASGISRERVEACRAADELLAKWWADPAHFPTGGQGTVPGTNFSWVLKGVSNPDVAALDAQVVRLEVMSRGSPCVSVDVVVPKGDAP